MGTTWTLIWGVLLAMALATILMWYLFRQLRIQEKQLHYNDERHRAELGSIRKSFEEQIYRLTDRLMATDARWRDVNHLLLSGQNLSPQLEQPSNFAFSGFLDRAGLSAKDIGIDKKLVFMLTPFHPHFEEPYQAVREVCLGIGLICLRGDEEHVQGDLLRHILALIAKSRVVIANVDGRNPNVFYELGVAHALDKKVLLISSSMEDAAPPFDIRTTRIIFWHDLPELKQRLREELLKIFVAAG